MIELRSAARARELANMLPAVAVQRMVAFEGDDGAYDPEAHGHIVVLEEGDTIEQLLPDFDYQAPPFEYVYRVSGVFEAVVQLAGDAVLALIIPDAPWLDARLRDVLSQHEIIK